MMGIWFTANAIATPGRHTEKSAGRFKHSIVLVSRRQLARRRGIVAFDHAAAQVPHAWQRLIPSVVFLC